MYYFSELRYETVNVILTYLNTLSVIKSKTLCVPLANQPFFLFTLQTRYSPPLATNNRINAFAKFKNARLGNDATNKLRKQLVQHNRTHQSRTTRYAHIQRPKRRRTNQTNENRFKWSDITAKYGQHRLHASQQLFQRTQ